jgi:GT2 family glycosyltransferase
MKDCLSATVIIPTKNRPTDLQQVTRSLFEQTVGPQSLIIVDQSYDEESRHRVEIELAKAAARGMAWKLNYIHDKEVSGGAMARNRAMNVADGNIWLFLDDDVVLEPEFIERLLAVYRENPDADGVSGIITNYPLPPVISRIWSRLFLRGPFHDERQPIYWRADRLRNAAPIVVRRFGGGLMSFRASVVRDLRFDENLYGVSDGEDVDFCTRLGPDAKMLIAPSARLEHRHSAIRLQDHWLRRSARGNVFLYRKNWNSGIFNRFCYSWLITGYLLVAVVASLRRLSFDPCRALRTGQEEARRAVPQSELARIA